jgi:CRISPR-associated protein Cas1
LQDATSFLRYLGFFHETKRGHAALASDLMEEWRPVIVDSLVLFLTSRCEIVANNFVSRSDGAVWLNRDGVARFLPRYDARLARRVSHQRLQQRLTYRQYIAAQVRQIVDYASGRVGDYKPFLSR